MQYRNFGDHDFEVSSLGFGAMRLPVIGDDRSNIDEKKAIKMMRYAFDNGVNYVDTAWPYHGGESEKVVGRALQDGYREQVKLATKFSWPWIEKELGYSLKRDEADAFLNKQLERLQTDHIDFYLLHGLKRSRWSSYKESEIFNWLDEKKKEGKIKYAGFSFHDDYEIFKEIIDAYDWDLAQIQYNYIDIEFQAGKKGLEYAAEKGIGLVIMEPLRGGSLANNLPGEVEKILNEVETNRTPADWALQWLWDQPAVATVLSGMSTLEQVKENINSASNSGVNSLSENEKEIIRKARDKYFELLPVLCTGCQYCVPCPNGVNIPGNFSLYNNAHIYDDYEKIRKRYLNWNEDQRASSCVECGACEPKCPQDLQIIDLLKDVENYFGG